LAFYKTLGLRLAHTEAESEQRVVVAFLPAGESEVELIEPVEEDGPVARFLEKRGEGLHHICFEVQDIEAILVRLEERGVELVDREPRIGTGGKKIAFVHPKDAHGVLIELYEKLPDEKIPPLVDLDALRERLRLESEAARERLRLQSEAARAGIEGFLSAWQKKDNGQGEE
jgi:methylmalonyl-CoA epimerase